MIADVTGVQFQGGVILGPWIEEGTLVGAPHLLSSPGVARGGRTEARRVWCRSEPGRSHAEALIVYASAPPATPIRVEAAAGNGVPRVLVGIEPDSALLPGVLTTWADTIDDGIAWASGHAAERISAVRVLDGAGQVAELLNRRPRHPRQKPRSR